MLKVKSVHKRIKDSERDILNDISLYVKLGEFVSIIGPSLVGKTMLLEICAGLERYHKGLCLLDDQAIVQPGKLAYIPKKSSLLPWKSLKDNILIAARRNLPEAEALSLTEQLLVDLEMENLANHFPSQLTLKDKKCATLLRAIAYGTDYMLLDEPLCVLDTLGRHKAQQDLKHLVKKYRKTVLMTTEDVDEAVFLSDRVYIMLPHQHLREIKISNTDVSSRYNSDFLEKCQAITEGLKS